MRVSQDPAQRSQKPAVGASSRLFRKTLLCRFFSKGVCDRGSGCQFAHGIGELKSKPDLKKTSLCLLWARGVCPHDAKDCAWAHGASELQATPRHAPDRGASGRSAKIAHMDFEPCLMMIDDMRASSLNVAFSEVGVNPLSGSLGGLRTAAWKGCPRCTRTCNRTAALFCMDCGSRLTDVEVVAEEHEFNKVGDAPTKRGSAPWSRPGSTRCSSHGNGSDDEAFSMHCEETPSETSGPRRINEGSMDSSNHGYDSDEEAFFAHREALYAVRRLAAARLQGAGW